MFLAQCAFSHLFQAVQMFMYGLLLHTAIASQVQLEIIIKILVETFQGDIFRFLLSRINSCKCL